MENRKKAKALMLCFILSGCQHYISFWMSPKKIDLSDRKMYKSKMCMTIHSYDTHYPLCPNQKCRDQWSELLERYKRYKDGNNRSRNFYLKECRLKKGEPKLIFNDENE